MSPTSGYVQLISYKEMCEWATREEVIIHLLKQPGDFITFHEATAEVYFAGELQSNIYKKLGDFIISSNKRTPDQEIRFSIKQIVEVAVRALSPGINDPHTAISCIHWLGAALSLIGKKHFPSIVEKSSNGETKVIRKPYSYRSIVDTCFDHLRLYAKGNIFVTLEILTAIRTALLQATQDELQNALVEKASTIVQLIEFGKISKEETHKVGDLYKEILAVYERGNKESA